MRAGAYACARLNAYACMTLSFSQSHILLKYAEICVQEISVIYVSN